MAQTKKKRRTKHRGNAAGMIETRGRTGRKPTASEAKRDGRKSGAPTREERLSRPPTWRGAINRAAISALLFAVLVVVLFDRSIGQAALLAAFMIVLYIPLGYYTDSLFWRRRQKKLAVQGADSARKR